MGATKRGKGTKLMAVADRFGLPLAVCTASASPHEVTLVAPTLDSRFLKELPQDDLLSDSNAPPATAEERVARGKAYLDSLRNLLNET